MMDTCLRALQSWRLALAVFGVCMLSVTAGVGCAKKGGSADRIDKVHGGLANALERVGRKGDAKEIRRACSGKARRSCACARTASGLALDRDLAAEALAVLVLAPQDCPVLGQRAEALARARKLAEADAQVKKALAANPNDRYAAYARAHLLYVRGELDAARKALQVAVGRGRGVVAHLLTGLIAFKQRRLPAALAAFEAMRKLEPNDASAHYNLALVHHQQNHYRLAREGYLAALRLHPGLVDARYNLVLLTHNAGASDEAKHHLRKLGKLVPKDARLARLQRLLQRPPKNPALRRVGPR